MKKRPIWENFYVLEGLDGSGTTTQLNRLLEYSRQAEHPALGTWEPSELPVGQFIRRILRKELRVQPETLARLFAADRNEHLFHPREGIRARLDLGETVICDRYLFSSLAYQSLETGFETVLSMNGFPLPEKLFFLDVPPEICAHRLARRDMVELFEERDFQQTLLANYRKTLDYFAGSEMKIRIIDGTQPAETVFQILKDEIFPGV